jgi:hypothetical protein
MDPEISRQLAIGAVTLVVGLSGWFLPYRWNLLRLRRGLDLLLPENARPVVPKVVGTVLVLIGMAILIGTAAVGSFAPPPRP